MSPAVGVGLPAGDPGRPRRAERPRVEGDARAGLYGQIGVAHRVKAGQGRRDGASGLALQVRHPARVFEPDAELTVRLLEGDPRGRRRVVAVAKLDDDPIRGAVDLADARPDHAEASALLQDEDDP